jgi:hypothetical protein
MWFSSSFDMPVEASMREIWCGPQGEAFGLSGGGGESHVLHYDGASWSVVEGSQTTARHWRAFDVAADGALWMVADDFEQTHAVYEIRDGARTEHHVEGVPTMGQGTELHAFRIAME